MNKTIKVLSLILRNRKMLSIYYSYLKKNFKKLKILNVFINI